VLVDDAIKMPGPEALPRDIQDFSYLNAETVDPGEDFHHHVNRLISEIDQAFGKSSAEGASFTKVGIGLAIAAVASTAVLWAIWPKFSYWTVENGLFKKETVVYMVYKPYKRTFYIDQPANHKHEIIFETSPDSTNDYYEGAFHDYRCKQHSTYAAKGPVVRTPPDIIIQLNTSPSLFDEQCIRRNAEQREVRLRWRGEWRNLWAPWYFLQK
jgi:hypothetical protein